MYEIKLVNDKGATLGMGYTDNPTSAEVKELCRQCERSGICADLILTPCDNHINMDELGDRMREYQEAENMHTLAELLDFLI